ncbi:MAG TPA: SUMF1/EgtB/PvdO family nonheme iron enzyme, partial [bacterium]
VVGLSWFAAAAYCHWLTELRRAERKAQGAEDEEPREKLIYRLPTEEEWEWAASGGKRPYPWGDAEPDATRANYGEKVGHTTLVGAYPAGATPAPTGLMDMAGNVWEWMDNLYREAEECRALRGGSWFNDPENLQGAARFNWFPDDWNLIIGFRVVCLPTFDRLD